MSLLDKKSGQTTRRRKSLSRRANELGEKAGDHFSELFIRRLKNVKEVRLWVAEWVLLVLIVFILAILQIFWYDDSYNTVAFSRGGTYTEATLGEVKSMNPLFATTSSERTLAKLMFANLVSPDTSGHQRFELIKDLTHDDAGKVWTVVLRDDLRWSDGEPITADDLIYTVELLNDSAAKTTTAVTFTNIKYEKTDDKTVVFTLPSVYLDFVDNLEFPLLPAHILKDVPAGKVYENDFSNNPVCSGPFVYNALQPRSGTNNYLQTIYLTRNENYFRGDTMLDNFTVRTYADTEAIITALKSSEVKATAELGSDVDLGDHFFHRSSHINAGVYAFMNTATGAMSKLAVRQAVQQGVDMKKVRNGVKDAWALDYPFLKSQATLSYPDLAKYDVDAAKQILTNAKYSYDDDGKLLDVDGMPVAVNIAVQMREPLATVAERFGEQLRALGFTVTVSVFDESQGGGDFFTTVVQPRSYDILIYQIDLGVSLDPFVYYSSTQATASGWNLSNYSNNLADNALLTARTTTDESLRKAKYEAFLKLWARDVPSIGIYQASVDYYYADDIRIYSENSVLTDAMDRFADVRDWAVQKKSVKMTP